MLSQSDTFDCRSGKVTNRMNIALLLQSIITGMYQMYTDIESGPKQGWSWVQKTASPAKEIQKLNMKFKKTKQSH